MTMASNLMIVLLIAVPLLFIGGTFLQIYLSRREAAWPGLILPIVSFLLSLPYLLSVAVVPDFGATVLGLLVVFVVTNIPTGIQLLIYFLCRSSKRKRQDVEKMNIQDL